MRFISELTIRGSRTDLERLLARVEARLGNGWRRNRQAEERLGRHGVRGPWDCCFSCNASADRPAAGLWVHARSPCELYVSTVVPLENEKLTSEERNRVLAEFEREFLRPAASETNVATEIVQRELSVEYELSPGGLRLLRDFAATADRADLDTNDRRRWNAFLVRVHQDDSRFDPSLLDEWLQRNGWSDPMRSLLMDEYEAARSLLLAYDEGSETS